MTGQLALAFPDPIPVVEVDRRRPAARVYPPLRKDRVWWRGRKRHVENVPVTIGALL